MQACSIPANCTYVGAILSLRESNALSCDLCHKKTHTVFIAHHQHSRTAANEPTTLKTSSFRCAARRLARAASRGNASFVTAKAPLTFHYQPTISLARTRRPTPPENVQCKRQGRGGSQVRRPYACTAHRCLAPPCHRPAARTSKKMLTPPFSIICSIEAWDTDTVAAYLTEKLDQDDGKAKQKSGKTKKPKAKKPKTKKASKK